MIPRATRLTFLFLLALLPAGAATADAGGPAVSREGLLPAVREAAPMLASKAWGDPRDLGAAAAAGAQYVRRLQADVTEDNALNGSPDSDPDDAGWDWTLLPFAHSASASALNCYGVTAQGVYQTYVLQPDPALLTVLKDAADRIVTAGPAAIRTASDIVFLLDFASLPGVVDPAVYTAGARAIWDYRLANAGDHTPAGLAASIRDLRHGQGYDNGIIPWDVSEYVLAAARLDAEFPGQGFAAAADDMAEVLWQDSFNASPGYFQPNGLNKGFDPDWATSRYWYYSLGVSGLIKAFAAAGVHASDLPLLQSLLLDCQYTDGAFSDQYGNDPAYNFRDYQPTAYAIMALARSLPPSGTTQAAVADAAYWLAYWQDTSGTWLWSDSSHTPEVGGECTLALACAAATPDVALGSSTTGPDPIPCGATKTVTVRYDRNDATPGLRGYEISFRVTGGVAPVVAANIADAGSLGALGGHYFRPIQNLDGSWTVNDAILGATPGLLADGDLFRVTLTATGNGPVTFDLLSYRMRDPANAPIYGTLAGTGFAVDCMPPAAVTNIQASPGHNKVNVTWTHNGADTAVYEVYRGLYWYGTTGVSAYPEYDDYPGVVPPRPADRAAAAASAEWELAGTTTVGTTSFVDVGPFSAGRGIYYYEVFPVDGVGNAGACASANDRATNYWLGDVWGAGLDPVPNGVVESLDVNRLGAAFGTADGPAPYDPVVDVGPTDDWSGFGIPLTDSVIDFEDLMIFAMNFGQVSPAKQSPASAGPVTLAWRDMGDGRWALELRDGSLQGLHVWSAQSVGGVATGELLIGQPDVFLLNQGSGLDANLALLGNGRSLDGTGALLVVTGAGDLASAPVVFDARSADNGRIEVRLERTGTAVTPAVFRLFANHPNPFNPSTTISFALPTAQPVKLAVYSLDGRRVASLLDEPRVAGVHEVTWNGLDDVGQPVASGSYLYRLDAGPYSQVMKMTLMK